MRREQWNTEKQININNYDTSVNIHHVYNEANIILFYRNDSIQDFRATSEHGVFPLPLAKVSDTY